MSERIGVINRPLKRKVAIRHDGEDFAISFLPEDTVVFRHAEASALPVEDSEGQLYDEAAVSRWFQKRLPPSGI